MTSPVDLSCLPKSSRSVGCAVCKTDQTDPRSAGRSWARGSMSGRDVLQCALVVVHALVGQFDELDHVVAVLGEAGRTHARAHWQHAALELEGAVDLPGQEAQK